MSVFLESQLCYITEQLKAQISMNMQMNIHNFAFQKQIYFQACVLKVNLGNEMKANEAELVWEHLSTQIRASKL